MDFEWDSYTADTISLTYDVRWTEPLVEEEPCTN